MRRSPAVATAEIAETSSADAVISQGVALSGADGLQRSGHDGSGITIVVLDQAFGAASRLNALAGTELPPIERQHRQTFDVTYGLAGRDFNANSSRHGEFVSEIVYDMAPAANYWFVNYHTPDEFGQAVDYIVEHDQAEHRRALELVPVRPLRRHRLVRAEGQPGGCGRRPLGQLGGQLPHPPLGGRVERRRRRRQPRRAG